MDKFNIKTIFLEVGVLQTDSQCGARAAFWWANNKLCWLYDLSSFTICQAKKVNLRSCCSVHSYKEVANSTSTTPIADREYSVLSNNKAYYVHYVFLRPYMSDVT